MALEKELSGFKVFKCSSCGQNHIRFTLFHKPPPLCKKCGESKELPKIYKKETGKDALWSGKETDSYIIWKKEQITMEEAGIEEVEKDKLEDFKKVISAIGFCLG